VNCSGNQTDEDIMEVKFTMPSVAAETIGEIISKCYDCGKDMTVEGTIHTDGVNTKFSFKGHRLAIGDVSISGHTFVQFTKMIKERTYTSNRDGHNACYLQGEEFTVTEYKGW